MAFFQNGVFVFVDKKQETKNAPNNHKQKRHRPGGNRENAEWKRWKSKTRWIRKLATDIDFSVTQTGKASKKVSGYAYIPNQNNRKTVVTFVTEDGYEITTDNFMMKKILRENEN